MDLKGARKVSYNRIRNDYKKYLSGTDKSQATINTMSTDAFYLWNNTSSDVFWDLIESADFEKKAPGILKDVLKKKSKGNPDNLVNGYVSQLRQFRAYISENNKYEINAEESLKDFLLDIDCLDKLAPWTGKINFFSILNITNTEIRHSNMLAWLIDPNSNHGLGDKIIKGIVQDAASSMQKADMLEILLMNYEDLTVFREKNNIDILAYSEKEKFLLCIENKIYSKEHDNQLQRYRHYCEMNYPDYRKMYIYLTPEREDANDDEQEYWYSMDYGTIVNIVDNAVNKCKTGEEAKLIISNYLDTLRRYIVGDEKLKEICLEIYRKHRVALDLIYENRPDQVSNLADIVKQWAVGKTNEGFINVDLEKCGKTNVRFKTATMSRILPDAPEPTSGWGTKNYYFYEVNLNENGYKLILTVSSRDIPDDLLVVCDKINELYPAKMNKSNWQWRRHFSTKLSKLTEEELDEEKIRKDLDKKLKEALSFEQELSQKMGI